MTKNKKIKRYLPPDLYTLLNHSSAIIIIDGKRGDGKTDFALKLASDALKDKVVSSVATNIITEKLKHITNFPDLDYYLKFGSGRKLFILDEAGQSLPSNRWMAKLSVKIMGTAQLIRHYHGRMIFIAPNKKFILKFLQDPSIKDCEIHKQSLKVARVKNYLTHRVYNLRRIAPTDLKFSQHPSYFTLEKPIKLDNLADYERDLYEYGVLGKSYTTIAKETGRHDTQIQRNIKKFAKVYFEQKTTNNLL